MRRDVLLTLLLLVGVYGVALGLRGIFPDAPLDCARAEQAMQRARTGHVLTYAERRDVTDCGRAP